MDSTLEVEFRETGLCFLPRLSPPRDLYWAGRRGWKLCEVLVVGRGDVGMGKPLAACLHPSPPHPGHLQRRLGCSSTVPRDGAASSPA